MVLEAPIIMLSSCQAKADEIAKLMNENEQLKVAIEGLKVCNTKTYIAMITYGG